MNNFKYIKLGEKMKQHDKERLKYGLLLSPLAIIAFLVLIVPIISIVLGSLKEDGSST